MDQDPRATAPPRQGPRPLALHLTLAGLTWTSCLGALPLLKSGSLNLSRAAPSENPPAGPSAELERLARQAPADLADALRGEVLSRSAALVQAIERYRRHPYRRGLPEPPVVWRDGTTRLLGYRRQGSDGAPLLMVPSLINRAYILDLSEERSLLRWFAGEGQDCFLVDWDRPGAIERGFSLTDYIAGRLETALDQVMAVTGRRPVLAGYCMGGLLALALAQRRQIDLAGLVLMATPWDFHADDAASARMAAATLVGRAPLPEPMGALPVDAIQALFAALDPLTAARKFLAFGRLPPGSPEETRFVALEDWLNDGVPLAAPVARECLGKWYGENTPARGLWRVAGRPVVPGDLALPTLCLVPGQDRIVPPPSALALGHGIPGAEIRQPALGHIGMVAGGRAPKALWKPLLTWIKARKTRQS